MRVLSEYEMAHVSGGLPSYLDENLKSGSGSPVVQGPDIVVNAPAPNFKPWFGTLAGVGIVTGNAYGGGTDFFRFGVGIGLAFNVGITGSAESEEAATKAAKDAAAQEGTLLCLGLCNDIHIDPFWQDGIRIEGTFGLGAFLYRSSEVQQ
jgi:hypothetical protein